MALKKAYAEIILNTAKESAARVMISDRKSARFHHDLCGTKEEALRLLVRMKQMVDAKVRNVLLDGYQRKSSMINGYHFFERISVLDVRLLCYLSCV